MSRAETEQAAPPPPHRTVAEGAGVGARVAQGLSDLLQFLVASALAGISAYAIWSQLPQQLDVRTDIVGYPIYSNFNINRYFWLYWLIAAFVPVVTLALFLILRKLIPRGETEHRSRPHQPAAEAPVPVATGRKLLAVSGARVAFVGAIFGLELASALSEGTGWVLSTGLPVIAGYAALVYLASLLVGRAVRFPTTVWERVALANALLMPFCVGALYAVSRSTEISVVSNGRVHEYSWLPWWLALGLTAVAVAVTWRAAVRARAGADFQRLERRLLLIVAGPVALFLLIALLPGAGTGIDFFHEGEFLAGERLTEDGAFPWRDLIFIHGFLFDVVFPAVGFNLFEDSRWGHIAGIYVVVLPLYWISAYYLFAYLFHRNWLFLVGTQLTLLLGVVFETHLRFLLLPFVLLLLAALLSKPSSVRAAAFMSVLFVQTIVTPETGIAVVAVFTTLIAFEAYYYDRSRRFRENFRRTLLCIGAGLVLTAVWLAFLAAFGALDDFVFTSLAFASDHALTGGLPLTWIDDRFRFAAVAPVVLVVLAFWYFAIQIVRRGSPTVADWTMGASALFVAIYYHKFLSRADQHVEQSYGVAVQLLYYTVYRAFLLIEDGVRRVGAQVKVRRLVRLAITAAALVILLVQAPTSVGEVVRDAPRRLDASVSVEPQSSQIGFIAAEGFYDDLFEDLDAILDAYVGQDGAVFDFSNSAALFHYFLERPAATRYYHVSMAIREETQEDLIDALERKRPPLVVFSSFSTGLPVWDDISNQVRHYRVSEYVHEHYRPLLEWNGFTFFWRNGVEPPPVRRLAGRVDGVTTEDLHFRTYPCDWGYAPNFFSEGPDSSRPARQLPARESGQLISVGGWAVDTKAKRPVAKVLAAVDGRVVAEVTPSTPRPDVAGHLRDSAYVGSGFDFGVPLPRSGPRGLRIYGVSRSGEVVELQYSDRSAWGLGRAPGPRSLLVNGKRRRVAGTAVSGFVDSSSISQQLLALEVPAGTRLGRHDWLEVEASAPLPESGFMLTDRLDDPKRGIIFKTLDRGERRVRVFVGACSQWHGYRARRLYLRVDGTLPIAAVRLYR